MPNVGSWNGVWTGAKNAHFAFKRYTAKRFLDIADKVGKSYWYNFGDGWSACVELKIVTAKEMNKIKRANSGFMGYDWMVKSILEKGLIEKGSN